MTNEIRPADARPGTSTLRLRLALVAVIVLTFVAVAPTLRWLEFSSGSENLNVATALEIRRDNRWLVPTLAGEARVAKPPLTAWITAAAIRSDTFRSMSDSFRATRESAEPRLRLEARWPFLLSSCLMLLACAELGRVLSGGDRRVAVVAAAVCATNLFFLRHGRLATTDVQLALWVALANVFLAHAVMRNRPWLGAAGAGLALGLAFMSKGPVALVQSVAPFAAFVIWEAVASRRRPHRDSELDDSPRSGGHTSAGFRLAQVAVAIALFALIALPWYALIAAKNPEVWTRWQLEVTREGATDLPPGKWYAYFSFVGFMMPWTAFLVAGIAVIVRDAMQSSRASAGGSARARGMLLALMMVVVPIVIMSFFRDRKERYLLPMIVPGAVIVARAVIEHFETRHLRNAADRIVVAIHWGTLMVIAIGLPVAGAMKLTTVEGARWFTPTLAAVALMAGVTVVGLGMVAHRRGRCGAIVAATLVLMLGAQALFMHGYRDSREGRSEMKPLANLIWRDAPDAAVFTTDARMRARAPVDLSIYLNRTVRWVDDASQVPAADGRPAVLVVRQRKNDPEPAPPPGWSVLGKTRRDQSWWHAFVRQ
jgi:4-amino-4-deoxy-L-arabinose transferase-like glycosyltransferase